jgi:hypothetical protein
MRPTGEKTMTRRPGLSLVEVLTALFILALGVIAIMTMFPLGASQMAIANREDRSALAAFGADGYFRTYWKTQIVESPNPNTESFWAALDNPNAPPLPPALNHAGLTPAGLTSEVSYPVFVDSMGYVARSGMSQAWLGDSGTTNVPRTTIGSVGSNSLLALRTCSLMDGLGYNDDGVPTTDRELRYNFLWVIQRPVNQNRFTANLTIVVFDNRPNLFAPVGSEQVFNNVPVTPGTSSITLGSVPDIKPGGWIMDASVGIPGRPGIRHANFYRVTAINGSTLELQSPIKAPSDNINAAYTGTFVILRGVSGVYQRPLLTAGN